ncbi:MAG: pyridoxal phosphate-dependent aminotransferase [Patescibacteria group bacterium]
MKSRLPQGGQNLFQAIKAKTADVEASGRKIWKLTIGQPSGPALESARRTAAEAVMSGAESMHEYQDNGSPGVSDFAKKFINLHQPTPLRDGLAYLPIPGIKPMLGIIPQACGFVFQGELEPYKYVRVGTMTNPGYPTPADQCRYLGVEHYALMTNPGNKFLVNPDDIMEGTTLLMLNYPHNPTGQVASEGFWHELCQFCQEHGIRIFNDAAYAMLGYVGANCLTLSAVAQHYPDLSWAEAYSASKAIGNGTGWRIGALVGSPDFIGDIATIKGNTDSGFFAPAAHGVLQCLETDMDSVLSVRDIYLARNRLLCGLLQELGLQMAVQPLAGFFSLWLAPRQAFGRYVGDGQDFNFLLMEETGVAGVHFGPYVRYSVAAAPIEEPNWQSAIMEAFKQADVKY